MAVRGIGRLRAGGSLEAAIRLLFANDEQGAVYDPSDPATLFQDSAGATPGALNQPVGLILDKRLGLAAKSSELVTNGTFSGGTTTGWTADGSVVLSVVDGRMKITRVAGPGDRASQVLSTTSGKYYELTLTAQNDGAQWPTVVVAGVTVHNQSTPSVTGLRFVFLASAATTKIEFGVGNGSTGAAYVDNISCKEIKGNHATQSTATSRLTWKQDANGFYHLESDGTDDALSATFNTTQPFDRISAVHLIGWTNLARVFGAPTSTAGRLLLAGTSGAPSLNMHSGAILGIGTLALGTNAVVTERFNGASSRGAINNAAYVSGDAGTVATDGLTLGASLSAGVVTNPGNVRIYGVVMREGLMSDAQIAMVRRYMGIKSGVSL